MEPTFYTAAPARVVTDYLPAARVRPWVADVGIAQRDSLTEDLPETLRRLADRASDAAIEALAAELRAFDVVIVDIAPTALEAARRAGVRALAVGNFDWAWIYAHYEPLRAWAAVFARWQAGHDAVELWPGPGLTGFGRVHAGGLLGRPAPPGSPRRLGDGAAYVLVSFGGFGLADADALLPRLPGVRWVLAPPMPRLDRDDCVYVEGLAYPALVAAADAVLTKPGYGIFTEAALAGTPLVWLDRGAFPEAPHLEAAMRERGDRKAAAATPTAVATAIQARLADERPAPVSGEGADRIVDLALRD